MGCDIHAHTEVKIDGKWHHYGAPNIHRYYRLFAYMAGVRNNDGVVPIAPVRGAPEDMTAVTKIDIENMGEDGHTHSWLSGKEISRLSEILESEIMDEGGPFSLAHHAIGYLFGNEWDVDGGEKYPPGVEDSRIVFWFDN